MGWGRLIVDAFVDEFLHFWVTLAVFVARDDPCFILEFDEHAFDAEVYIVLVRATGGVSADLYVFPNLASELQ
jgi:hypothetical protein